MTLVATTPTEVLEEALSLSFRQDQGDGYWYPVEDGVPVVRIYVGGGSYVIERRRNERSAWMPVRTADVAEFDLTAFQVWRANWPAVA